MSDQKGIVLCSIKNIIARVCSLIRSWLLLACTASLLIATASAGERSVLAELSRQYGTSIKRLKQELKICGTGEESQGTLTLCALRNAVEAELQMKAALHNASSPLNREQQRGLEKSQQTWLVEAQASCNAEADAEAKGGSMWRMLYYDCIGVEMSVRAVEVQRRRRDETH